MKRVDKLRKRIVKEHGNCLIPVIGCRSFDFGEVLCGHIHSLEMTFKDLTVHFGISFDELADIVADHIRRLEP